MAVALGLDLAWSERNPSGCVAIDDEGNCIDERLLIDDREIIAWVESMVEQGTVLAVDAPLLVPNENGRRRCETELHRVYGSRKAGPHPSNRSLLLRINGRIRGEDLVSALVPLGFTDPWSAGDRTILEVYPHPALIEIFGLPERLAYKKGRVADRRAGLRRLEALLATLTDADPPLRTPRVMVTGDTRGRSLKGIEDLLDARICAWMALLWSRGGRSAIRLFGSPEEGHIAVPFPPTTR